MPKMKTHKGLKKVLNKRQSGSITIGHPGLRHNTGDNSASFNRGKRDKSALAQGDARRLKNLIK